MEKWMLEYLRVRNPGEEMVLKGRGAPALYAGDKGDLFVTFRVQLPRSLTPRQRDLLERYADDVEGRTPYKGKWDPRSKRCREHFLKQSSVDGVR
ncbi:hypothetical protein QCA50_001513 [Cerrena zonata]|uniref:Chaperone DnaJ C-terminal domain-containing protein n=1 Tax=Cerrena zonata TaxID=2478898 RepID=A0AAW0GX81_9APHY